jgi:hypothetical protein
VLIRRANTGYQVWLRDTIYKRLVKPGQKAGFGPTVMTFVTSAFWVSLFTVLGTGIRWFLAENSTSTPEQHGIAPGYYCMLHATFFAPE